MKTSQLIFAQVDLGHLQIEKLADGSTAVIDKVSQNVHSLNPAASVAWETCGQGATLTDIRAALETRFGAPVDEEAAWIAVSELERAKLVSASGPESGRRAVLKTMGLAAGSAVAAVLTLTGAEQRASAMMATSVPD